MRTDKAQQAIDAAIVLFGEQGFDNTSTQSIAKQAGIGNATLFKYFASKDVLIRDCYLDCKMDMFRTLKADLDPNLAFEPFLRTIWLNYLKWAEANPQKLSFMQQITNSRFYDPEVEQKIECELLFFQVAMKAAITNGEILEEEPSVIQATMVAFLNMAVAFKQTQPEIEEQRIYKLMLNSLKISESNPS